MVLQDLHHDLLQDEEFAEVRDFLVEHNLRPDNESAILDAIRARGWELQIDGMTGDWTVSIRLAGKESDYQVIIAHESDRRRALFRAVRMALSWLTPEQERESFDRATRAMMDMSAEEFVQRFDNGELDVDDPHVRHLRMLRPLGW